MQSFPSLPISLNSSCSAAVKMLPGQQSNSRLSVAYHEIFSAYILLMLLLALLPICKMLRLTFAFIFSII